MATKECKKIIEQLPLYIDSMLSESEVDKILNHIDKCPDCKKEYNYLKAMMVNIAKIPPKESPPDFHEKLMERIRREKKKPRQLMLHRVSAYAAAAAVIALSFVALGQFENGKNSEVKEQYITSKVSEEPINEEATKSKPTPPESKKSVKAEEPKNEIINEEQIPVSISLEEEVKTPVKATVTVTEDIRDEISEILSSCEKDDTGYIVPDIESMLKKLKDKGAEVTLSTDGTLIHNYIIIK